MHRSRDWRRAQFKRHVKRRLRLLMSANRSYTATAVIDGNDIVYTNTWQRREYRNPIYKSLQPRAYWGLTGCRCDYCIRPYRRRGRRYEEWNNATED